MRVSCLLMGILRREVTIRIEKTPGLPGPGDYAIRIPTGATVSSAHLLWVFYDLGLRPGPGRAFQVWTDDDMSGSYYLGSDDWLQVKKDVTLKLISLSSHDLLRLRKCPGVTRVRVRGRPELPGLDPEPVRRHIFSATLHLMGRLRNLIPGRHGTGTPDRSRA